ncbi:N-acetyltransferase [Salmonella enterica subsp. enterica serovar Choleraesuis]|nr:N-acetyltransferase [Salmonella enterica subsp. enterica serovar Choleraesuis]
MECSLRIAEPKDAGLLSALGYASYLHHLGHLWQNPEELAEYLEQEFSHQSLRASLSSGQCCWLIASDPSPIGLVKVIWQSPMPIKECRCACLDKLYLAPAATGLGYGSLLFNAARTLASERGECYLWLEVLEKNPRAHRFYLRAGMDYLTDTVWSTPSQRSKLHVLGMAL